MVKQQILRLQIPMTNMQFMQILQPTNQLLKQLTSLLLFNPPIIYNILKQLSILTIFHHKEQVLGSLNNLIELDDIRMPD